jgi:hypothetical protein
VRSDLIFHPKVAWRVSDVMGCGCGKCESVHLLNGKMGMAPNGRPLPNVISDTKMAYERVYVCRCGEAFNTWVAWEAHWYEDHAP